MTVEQIRRYVARLWAGGERNRAIREADRLKLADDKRPAGMADHKAKQRRELQ